MPHPAAPNGEDVKLVKSLNSLRLAVANLEKNRNYRGSYSYWRQHLQQLRSLVWKMDSRVNVAALIPLVLQKWWAVKSDVDRWVAVVN
jgi:hypothetical protein